MTYDIIIVGAGPAGIFCALEIAKSDPSKKILLLEKGNRIENRKCPKRHTGVCAHCKPCNITTGFSGAGAFSDGKLILSPEVGGDLLKYYSEEKLSELIREVDDIYLSYGADTKVYGTDDPASVEQLELSAIRSNLKLIATRLRHIGTEKSYELYTQIQSDLLSRGVEIRFNNPVKDLIIENGRVSGVLADQRYDSERVVLSIGREGSEWLEEICRKYGIETGIRPVDIGVRVEVRNEVMAKVNETLYESKLVYYTKTFDDMARTFCHNPSGVVAAEYYQDTRLQGIAVVNGHSYKDARLKTENTNFAILVSNYFTEPFKEPTEYGKYIARLANLLSGNRVIVQRFGDFNRGRRTTPERLHRNNIRATLKDAVPGDLSLVLPYRIMLDIKEMIEALDHLFPGMGSDETLLYGVEVKFYSNRIKTDGEFQSSVKGLYAAGDGAGLTRGLMQASVNGLAIGRTLAGKKKQD